MFFRSTIFSIFSFTHEEKEVWPDGTHPMLFAESSCVCMPSFRPVAPFFFQAKVPFAVLLFVVVVFFKYRNGCGHIDMLTAFPW